MAERAESREALRPGLVAARTFKFGGKPVKGPGGRGGKPAAASCDAAAAAAAAGLAAAPGPVRPESAALSAAVPPGRLAPMLDGRLGRPADAVIFATASAAAAYCERSSWLKFAWLLTLLLPPLRAGGAGTDAAADGAAPRGKPRGWAPRGLPAFGRRFICAVTSSLEHTRGCGTPCNEPGFGAIEGGSAREAPAPGGKVSLLPPPLTWMGCGGCGGASVAARAGLAELLDDGAGLSAVPCARVFAFASASFAFAPSPPPSEPDDVPDASAFARASASAFSCASFASAVESEDAWEEAGTPSPEPDPPDPEPASSDRVSSSALLSGDV